MANDSIAKGAEALERLIPGFKAEQIGTKWYLTVDSETMIGALGPAAASAALEFAANLIQSGKLHY